MTAPGTLGAIASNSCTHPRYTGITECLARPPAAALGQLWPTGSHWIDSKRSSRNAWTAAARNTRTWSVCALLRSPTRAGRADVHPDHPRPRRQRSLGGRTRSRVAGATEFADEHGSHNDLVGLNELQRVNHSKVYQADDCNKHQLGRELLSRVQRAYVGIHHRFSLKCFDWYVAEFAWREDCREVSNRGRRSFYAYFAIEDRPKGEFTSRYSCRTPIGEHGETRRIRLLRAE